MRRAGRAAKCAADIESFRCTLQPKAPRCTAVITCAMFNWTAAAATAMHSLLNGRMKRAIYSSLTRRGTAGFIRVHLCLWLRVLDLTVLVQKIRNRRSVGEQVVWRCMGGRWSVRVVCMCLRARRVWS